MGSDPHLTATSQGWTNGSCLLALFQVTSNEKLLESLRNTGSLLQALERLAPAHRYEEPSSGQNHFCRPPPPPPHLSGANVLWPVTLQLDSSYWGREGTHVCWWKTVGVSRGSRQAPFLSPSLGGPNTQQLTVWG